MVLVQKAGFGTAELLFGPNVNFRKHQAGKVTLFLKSFTRRFFEKSAIFRKKEADAAPFGRRGKREVFSGLET